MSTPIVALYPGTFDPITNGHIDIIERASRLFPKLIVAVANNRIKSTLLDTQLRCELVQTVVTTLPNVSVCTFDTLLVDFAKQQHVSVIIRGLRVVSDFEYELQMVNANRALAPNIETVFLPPSPQTCHISSSLVREIVSYGGDISAFVPNAVKQVLVKR